MSSSIPHLRGRAAVSLQEKSAARFANLTRVFFKGKRQEIFF